MDWPTQPVVEQVGRVMGSAIEVAYLESFAQIEASFGRCVSTP
jgi:hypothetical protein